MKIKIVIAPDSFKGSITAIEAAIAIDKGIKRVFAQADTVLIPVADGGEGTLDNLVAATNGTKVNVSVKDPLGQPIQAYYGVLGNKQTCVIEMANASGLGLVPPDERNPLITTTYGTGQLIKQALDDGYRKFILAIGGSATNDGGAGMLQALGVRLLDAQGNEIGFGGGELHRINRIELGDFDERVRESTFLIASDVQNPLLGMQGASYIFGPQKGATEQTVQELEHNMGRWADLVLETTGVRLHDLPGAGAAGGIGGAFQAFFPAEIRRGIDVVLEYTGLYQALAGADLVITGEGQVDFQTSSGKTPMGVAQAAQQHGIPTIIVAGSIGQGIEELYQYGVVSLFSMMDKPMSLEEAMEQAPVLLEQCTEQFVRTFFHTHIR